jgi:tRNA dimethylallyltransferase
LSKIIFIVGPTATGKSEVSFLLAQHLQAEIVSCDSMLIYKEPKVITSKPPSYILEQIAHHFINIVSVEDTYNVFDYYRAATSKINELFDKGRAVVVCGGSGLYMKAILDGIFEGGSKDEQLRKDLYEKARIYGNNYLFEELKRVDPLTTEKISPHDLRRIIRALEVYYLTGIPISRKKKQAQGLYGKLPVKIFGLHIERGILYRKINQRVEEMFRQGAIEEVKQLLELNLSITAKKIIGIKEIGEYLEKKIDIGTAKENMKKNTRHLAKRQVTWFKRDRRIKWINISSQRAEDILDNILSRASLG